MNKSNHARPSGQRKRQEARARNHSVPPWFCASDAVLEDLILSLVAEETQVESVRSVKRAKEHIRQRLQRN